MTTAETRREVLAPLSGLIVPLDSIPDPVFAQKMVGDGVAIDPISHDVVAPVSGTITQLHHARHALAITQEDGIEILIHVGLDTVNLKGKGFTPHVSVGATVKQGQVLMSFDPEILARDARSLLTVVVVTNVDRVAAMDRARHLVDAGKSVLLNLRLAKPAKGTSSVAGRLVTSGPILLPNSAGLHARPAAVLATEAKKYESEIRLLRGTDSANAKSVVAILGLSTRQGDRLQVEATGPDSEKAVQDLSKLLADGCHESASEAAPKPAAGIDPQKVGARTTLAGEFAGASASPGLAVGRVFQYRANSIEGISIPEQGGSEIEERAKLRAALQDALRDVGRQQKEATDPSRASILEAHRALLEDPGLLDTAEQFLKKGKSAVFSWKEAFTQSASILEKLDNPLLRERAADIRDIGHRVFTLLSGIRKSVVVIPEGSILVAEELTPSDTASFDRTRVLGFCTVTGGPTSHVAILARSMGIPAICGIDPGTLNIPNGSSAILDGLEGLLKTEATAAEIKNAKARIEQSHQKHEAEKAMAHAIAKTKDGHRVEVVANILGVDDARAAVAGGAEGVGLLRSEFLFSGRETAPSEDEQAAAYLAVAQTLGESRPLVVRTLDVGGDKPLSYLPLPKEDNPFLGVRGIRVSFERPDLFRTQLRAILRAGSVGNLHVMFPMIAGIDELRAAKQLLAEEQKSTPHPVKVGVMIEVPSAAAIAELLAPEVDFFSIGTNDLTQYTLAMDRGHPRLAKQADALHPGVLRMIRMTVEGAHRHKKWVGVCGGIASDALAVPLLVGLGVDELSVSVPALASVKAVLARFTLNECQDLARDVMNLKTTAEIRSFLRNRTGV